VAKDGATGDLEIVDTSTGALTTGPTISGAPFNGNINAMSFNLSTVLFGVNTDNSVPAACRLVQIDVGTGVVTSIGNLPDDTDALAFSKDGPEMFMYRGISLIPDGGNYTFNAPRGVVGPLDFWIINYGGANLTLTTPVTVSGQTNCTASPATNPISPVQPGRETKAVITLGTPTLGSYSFTVTINNNDADENPYTFTVSGNVFEIGGSNDPTKKSDGDGCTLGGPLAPIALIPILWMAARRWHRSRENDQAVPESPSSALAILRSTD
jgi:hypothetical protein